MNEDNEGHGEHEAPARNYLSNRVYDHLKFIAMVALPAAGTLYFGLADIWHLPKAHEVTGTVVIVDTFLGVLLGLSSVKYNNSPNRYYGTITVNDSGDNTVLETALTRDPVTIPKEREVIFKVIS